MKLKQTAKSTSIALGVVLASGASTASADAPANPFAAKALSNGYMELAEGKCGEAKCGSNTKIKKSSEGKCGEAKCGSNKTSAKSSEGKCGEAKCGSNKAPAKSTEGKCGEAKCGANK